MGALDESGLAILRDWVTDKIGKKRAIKKTLWTNPSPTANFAAQTVTLSESAANFDLILINCRLWASDQYYENLNACNYIWTVNSSSGQLQTWEGESNNRVGRRRFNVSGITVKFDTGYYNANQHNECMVPIAIYGVNLNSDILEYNAMTLLWENASPRSNFTMFQSVPVDLSDYDGAVIEYSATKDESLQAPIFTRPVAIGDGDKLMGVGTLSNIYGSRFCAVLRDSVYFGEPLNHSTSINEAVSIPIAIYGVKNVGKRIPMGVSSGRTYVVKPYDPYGGSISGFKATKQQNGNAVYMCGWGLGQTGLGFQMITKGESNSYAMMISNEPISLSAGESLYIKVNISAYNGSDYFFLIKNTSLPSDIFTATRTAANMYGLAEGSAKLELVTTANSFTKKRFKVQRNSSSGISMTDLDVSGNNASFSLTGSFYLAFMCAGSSSPYYGKLCVEEAYIE